MVMDAVTAGDEEEDSVGESSRRGGGKQRRCGFGGGAKEVGSGRGAYRQASSAPEAALERWWRGVEVATEWIRGRQ